ncbi:MAG TPA: hypothetical protein VGH71_06155, partial [Gammaproteobacteria bacterium]
AAKRRCADPKQQGQYLSKDPQSQALADDLDQQTKDWETAYTKSMQANAMQNIGAAQAAAADPRQIMAMAQMQQASMNRQLPPNPAVLADQLFQPPYDATLSALQANAQDETKSGQGWQAKYNACGNLPVGAGSCQKLVEGKANAEAADIGKQRPALLEKYYSDLNRNWSQYRDGVQKYLDAIKINVPQGVDPNGYQVKILLNNNLAQRLDAVHTAAQRSAAAICPGFLYEAEQQYGGVCGGEGC